jgi:hypothetical protein
MKGRIARASGGKTQDPESGSEKGVKVSDTDKGGKWYSGDTSNVKKEAEQPTGFKKGGKVSNFGRGKMSEGMEMKMKKKDGGCAMGDKSKDRLDRAKRASGGAISGSRNPFAMSEKTSERPGFKGKSDIND